MTQGYRGHMLQNGVLIVEAQGFSLHGHALCPNELTFQLADAVEGCMLVTVLCCPHSPPPPPPCPACSHLLQVRSTLQPCSCLL